VEKPEGRRPLRTVMENGRIILEQMLKKSVGRASTGLIVLRIGKKWWTLVNAAMKRRFP
jgi:hypothetical protein